MKKKQAGRKDESRQGKGKGRKGEKPRRKKLNPSLPPSDLKSTVAEGQILGLLYGTQTKGIEMSLL